MIKLTSRSLANGDVVTACNVQYLVALCMEVLRARSVPLVKVRKFVSRDAQIRRLQFICAEVKRLLENPDLFPSAAARARFAAILALDANLQFVRAVKGLLLADIQTEINGYSRAVFTRPIYQEGSKGWENFLLNMAPGAPQSDQRLRSTPKSCYQMVPTVGLRIVGDYNREEQLLERWIKDVSTSLCNRCYGTRTD